jgi:chemotaxis protein histidine kinase CheA
MKSDEISDDSQFLDRIAEIRARFASKLTSKIRATEAVFLHLAYDENDAVDAVAAVYRRFHEIYGISSTVGFEATGQAARILDGILIEPFRDRRGLRTEELAQLKEGLETLRIAAQAEMRQQGKDEESKS